MSISELDSLIDTYAATLADVRDVVSGATEAQWATPTGCPGWSVADNVSHIIGLELHFSGRPDPGADLAVTEASVGLRRGRSKTQLLSEYDAVTPQRIAALRSEIVHPAFDPRAPVVSPFGTLPAFASLLRLRIFDLFAHGQDIRRALGIPGALEGPAFDIAMRNIVRGLTGLPRSVPSLTGCVLGVVIDGDAQLVDWTGPKPVVRAGSTDEAAVALTMTASNLVALACGRTDADLAGVGVSGKQELATAVLAAMAITP